MRMEHSSHVEERFSGRGRSANGSKRSATGRRPDSVPPFQPLRCLLAAFYASLYLATFLFQASRETLQTRHVGLKPLQMCGVLGVVNGPSLQSLMRLLQRDELSVQSFPLRLKFGTHICAGRRVYLKRVSVLHTGRSSRTHT